RGVRRRGRHAFHTRSRAPGRTHPRIPGALPGGRCAGRRAWRPCRLRGPLKPHSQIPIHFLRVFQMPIQNPWDEEVVRGVQRFVQQKIIGRAQELEADQRYPEEIVSALKELGLFSIAVPQEYGGLELSVPTYAKIMEELAAGWTTLSCFLNSHTSASSILARHGTEVQRRRWLPRMATGELRVAIALTEPNGGSDLQAIRSKARKEADGGYVLNGSKVFITNGARAGAVVVLARTADGKNGISLFMIEKGLPGFTVGANARTLGHRHI